MAFDEETKVKLGKVLEISRVTLNAHLTYYDSYLTPETIASVLDDLDEWDSFIGKSHIKIEANTANKGASINFAEKLERIRKSIIDTLSFGSDTFGREDFGSPYQATFTRG